MQDNYDVAQEWFDNYIDYTPYLGDYILVTANGARWFLLGYVRFQDRSLAVQIAQMDGTPPRLTRLLNEPYLKLIHHINFEPAADKEVLPCRVCKHVMMLDYQHLHEIKYKCTCCIYTTIQTKLNL